MNLVEILKDCPKGIKLYSTVYGEVEFNCIKEERGDYPIRIILKNGSEVGFTSEGMEYTEYYEGECVLFPSREQRDWSKFKSKQSKFDPKILNPFDKILVRDNEDKWRCTFFSHIRGNKESLFKYATIDSDFECFIPYNVDTKYLVGTTKEAPEYYRYWED